METDDQGSSEQNCDICRGPLQEDGLWRPLGNVWKKKPDAKKKLNAQSNFSNNVRHKLQKYETVNSKDVLMRKNKIQEIKEKFRQQEEKALSGKVSIENFSKEELLFGFYL